MIPTLDDRRQLLAQWTGEPRERCATLLERGDCDGFDRALLAYLRERRSPRFYFDPRLTPERAAEIRRDSPDKTAELMQHADAIMAGKFPLSDGWSPPYVVQLPREFSWYDPPPGADPQFVYTLNRHRFWAELAMAFRFTHESRYADELLRQIVSWCEQSPPPADYKDWQKRNPRWWLLDTAIRADTWPWVFHLMLHADAWTPRINTLFLHRLWMHAFFVDPEIPDKLGNNWVIMMAQGVLNIAILFPEFRQSAVWEKHAAFHLQRCLDEQFFADGGHNEQAPGYHEGCIAWILEPLYLAKLNGRAWAEAPWKRMHPIGECLFQLLHPNGEMPDLSDSGRGPSMALPEAAAMLKAPSWARFGARLGAREAWLLGTQAVALPDPLPARPSAVAFPALGYYVMRSGDDAQARQLIFDCGPHGNWHGHFDLLSFELFGYGRVLISDPGVPIYADGPERAWQRGAPAHNTISIDGQDYVAMEGPDNPGFKVTAWEVADDHLMVGGFHRGYEGMPGKPLVGRCLWYDRADTFVVVDWGRGSEEHEYTVSFTFPTTRVSPVRDGEIHTLHGDGDVLVRTLSVPSPAQEQRMVREERPWTVVYGIQKPGIRLAVSRRGTEAVFAAVMCTYTGGRPPRVDATVEVLTGTRPVACVRLPQDGVERIIRLERPF